MSTERELVEVTKFKGAKFDDRQDYLAALVKLIDKLAVDDFDNLSDEAADWFNDAVTALNKHREIRDFEDDDEPEKEPEDEEPANEVLDEDDAGPQNLGDNHSIGIEGAEGIVEEPTNPPNVEGDRSKAKADRKLPTQKQVKPPKPLPGPKKGERNRPSDEEPVVMDRFGVIIGTKTHEAVKLWEKGATRKEIDEKIGGSFSNILKKLAQDGHRVEKLPDHIFKLTHKDDIAAKPAKAGKKQEA